MVKKDEQKISDVVPSSVAVSNVAVVMEGLRGILESPSISLDTETTGLRPYHGARFFSVIIADGKSVAYLNFHPDHPDVFDTKVLAELLRAFVGTIYMHNAKFDMHMLRASGIELNPLAHIHCTAAIGRVCYSALPSYSLEYCAKYFCGEDKDDKVKEYILKNGLWEWETVPGKKSRSKNLHYDRVPYELIRPYAEQDAKITWKLGEKQRAILKERDEKRDPKYPSIMQVYANECALTKVLFEMESVGVRIDRTFCERALEHELKRMADAEKLFEAATGKTFKASGKLFAEIFDGEKFEYTDKGNPTFESDVLKKFSSPVAETILEYRDAKSNSNYYAGFLYQADSDDVVHTSFNQNGAATGRLSAASPNTQNMRKDEDEDLKAEFVPRRAFIPRDGYYFAMLDYDAMEYRLMMDYAQAHDLIAQVKGGKDVHSATAELAGVTRSQAKCVLDTTLIFSDGRYRRISSASPGSSLLVDKFYPSALSSVRTDTGDVEIREFYNNGEGDALVVSTTKSVLVCSPSHRFKMADGSFKPASILTKDELLAEPLACEYDVSEYVNLPFNPFLHPTSIKNNFFCRIDESMGYFMGIFLGDGTANKGSATICTGAGEKYEEWIQLVRDSLSAIGFKPGSYISRTNEETGHSNTVINIGSTHTVGFLEAIGLFDRDEGRKILRIPEYIFNSPRSVRESVLAGLVDTDGTVSRDGSVSWTSKSPELTADVVCLASSIGVKLSCEISLNKTYLKYYFRLRFAKASNGIFKRILKRRHKLDRVMLSKQPQNLSPNKVKQVYAYGKAKLVDLSVGGEHTYYTNGLLTHNTINFTSLYGGGAGLIAERLGISKFASQDLMDKIFSAAPEIPRFISQVKARSEIRGAVVNWFGRVTSNRDKSYASVNYLIQGGCADVMKLAMVRIAEFLRDKSTKMLLTIHDELVFEIPFSEAGIETELRDIMEKTYPARLISLTSGIEHSTRSLADKIEGQLPTRP